MTYRFHKGQLVEIASVGGSFREKYHYVVEDQEPGDIHVWVCSEAPDDKKFRVYHGHLTPITGPTKEQEAEEVRLDLEAAVKLLERHGFAFRIYGPEDLGRMLDLYAEDDKDPVDTRTFRAEIIDHVMKGDDWADVSKKGYDDEVTLWTIIEGTRHDHPEWFVG